MITEKIKLSELEPGGIVSGFVLEKKEYIEAKRATLYTLRHKKCGAQLLYFDRPDLNKTFAVSFKTLPENDTGVFHILEHSVLNGSKKYPVKEPFVSLLQSSMQTFLNAYTFGDKTMFPVSSRNEQDLFNLMSVYLDAVFCPSIYKKPEIFMQEGWHYEFDPETGEVSYNGVVFSEMKGAYSDVERLMGDAADQLMFPDTCYGFSSGGRPLSITDLSYKQFIETHERFYHPTNARFFLDGHMDIDSVLEYIDGEYLCNYDYREPDFDFDVQKPCAGCKNVSFAPAQPGDTHAHMSMSKILCSFDEIEKLYAAKILADYLTGSNEAPLKRAILEAGLAQDVGVEITDGIFQPTVSLVVLNTYTEKFEAIRGAVPETAARLAREGLDRSALRASIERFAFSCREVTEPYGVELAIKALDGWLYGGDPMMHINNAWVFDSLREKLDGRYFEELLLEMLADGGDKCYVYATPSDTKLEDDARCEREKIAAETAEWSDGDRRDMANAVRKMQEWQQSQDDEQALSTLPALDLTDVARDVEPIKTEELNIAGRPALKIGANTDGIVYLDLYFDISDFSCEQLRLVNVLTSCLGELRTENLGALELQNKIKATLGGIGARVDLISREGELNKCAPQLLVSASMLRENVPAAMELISELLQNPCWSETDKRGEIIKQTDYFLKQSLMGNGHSFAVTKALSAFSAEAALREALEGESFAQWFASLAEADGERLALLGEELEQLAKRAFCANRLFIGFGGETEREALEGFVRSLPERAVGEAANAPAGVSGDCAVEIPADVGFSALGGNLYALGGKFSGAWSVLSSLMTFGYLWGAVRVQGGAYGTGMSVRANGDVFCYSYRDPNLPNSEGAFDALPDVLDEMLTSGMPLDDIIIGTVNTTDPLLDPAGVCELSCRRYLKGTSAQDITKLRHEILDTTADDLRALIPTLRKYVENGVFCAIGSPTAIEFVKN